MLTKIQKLIIAICLCLFVSVCLAQDLNNPPANTDVLEWLTMHWTELFKIGAYIIAIASIAVKLTPTQADDKFLGKVMKFLKAISLNKVK